MRALTVRDLMSTDVVTLEESEDLDLAEQLMNLARIRHLPVLKDGRVVGLITQRDLLKVQASMLLDGGSQAQQRELNLWVKAGWVMTRDVVMVEPQAPLKEAGQIIVEQKIGCLPVVEDGTLVGILTETDFVRHTLRTLEDA